MCSFVEGATLDKAFSQMVARNAQISTSTANPRLLMLKWLGAVQMALFQALKVQHCCQIESKRIFGLIA